MADATSRNDTQEANDATVTRTPTRYTLVLALILVCAGRTGRADGAVDSAGDIVDALSRARPGDVIVVAGGTYPVNLLLTADGRPDAPITLRGAPGEQVVLEAADPSLRVIDLRDASHWRIEGLTIRGSRHANVRITGGSDVTLRDCVVSDAGKKGIIANGDRVTIERCVIRDVRQPFGGEDTQGIAVWDATRLTIRDNRFETPGDAILIGGAGTISRTSSDVTIEGNHFHTLESWARLWHVENAIDVKNVDGLIVRGNVIHHYRGRKGDDPTGCAINIVTRDPEVGGRIARVLVERNVIVDVNRAISFQGADGPGGGAVVRHNLFGWVKRAHGAAGKPPSAIHLGDWDGIEMHDNLFVGVDGAAVHTYGRVERMAFERNLLLGAPGIYRETTR
jgi:hypothetical protein